jgi:predicted unusual protein kinase regulating ubiquinone biosynthesis (AarF/ABC1/UbiB family)
MSADNIQSLIFAGAGLAIGSALALASSKLQNNPEDSTSKDKKAVSFDPSANEVIEVATPNQMKKTRSRISLVDPTKASSTLGQKVRSRANLLEMAEGGGRSLKRQASMERIEREVHSKAYDKLQKRQSR